MKVMGAVMVILDFPQGGIVSALFFLGSCAVILGCMIYAEGKGYSRWLGLIGLLSLIGVIFLALLPDQRAAER